MHTVDFHCVSSHVTVRGLGPKKVPTEDNAVPASGAEPYVDDQGTRY